MKKPNHLVKLTRACAYCRVSTDKQDQLNSLEAQKGFFQEFADTKNYNLIEIYADEGITGTRTKKRKEFLRLMNDARLGMFDIVLIKDVSRLARNTVDFLECIRTLKALKIEVQFISFNQKVLADGNNSEFMLTLMAAMAQEESANMSTRVKFGKKINAKNGRVPNMVYGYDKTKGDYFNLTINENEAETVRKIFDLYINEGFGALKIAQKLNDEGKTTKRGSQFSQNAVVRILKNEIYFGKIVNGKERVTDFLTGVRETLDEGEHYIKENMQMAIISEEQFLKASNILKKRNQVFKHANEKHSNKHLFSTLIKCSECGFSFRQTIRKSEVDGRIIGVKWVCSCRNGQGKGKCSNAAVVDEKELQGAISNYIVEIFSNKDSLKSKIVDEFVTQYQSKLANQSNNENLTKAYEKNERARKKYQEMFVAELITIDELKEKMHHLNILKMELDASLEMVNSNLTKYDMFDDILEKTFNNLDDVVSVDDMTNTQLKDIIEKIVVSPDGKIDVYLRLFSDLGLRDGESVRICTYST